MRYPGFGQNYTNKKLNLTYFVHFMFLEEIIEDPKMKNVSGGDQPTILTFCTWYLRFCCCF